MKQLNDLYKKYEGLIKLVLLLSPLVFATWQYLVTYIHVPQRQDDHEAKDKRDSIYFEKQLKAIRSLDSMQTHWAQQDIDTLEMIKGKLKRNYIN